MAGANFEVKNLIDQKITTDLKDIATEANNTAVAYANLTKRIAEFTNVKPSNLGELQQKTEKYNSTIKELQETQNKLVELQEKYKESVRKIDELTKNAIKNAREDAKAKSLNADAELKLQKAQTERLRQQRMLNQEQAKQKMTTEQAIELSRKEVHSIAEAEAVNKRLRQVVKDLTDAEDQGGKIRQKLNSAINVNTSYIKRNRDALTQAKMTVGDYREQIKLAMMELKNGNNTMKNFGIVAKGFGGVLKTGISDGAGQVASSVGGMIKGFVGAQAVITGVQALVGAFKKGITTAIDFQAANSKLAAILGTTAKETKGLQLSARELGATTSYTAAEATNLQVELAKLGFTAQEIQQSTKYVLRFAQATGAELPEAAALAGASLRMFNADATESERYVSAMAVATTKSALSFSDLQTAMPIAGSVASTLGFEIEDVLALLGRLADAGVDASSAGTATRNILLNLADGGGKLNQALGGNIKTLDDFIEGLKNAENNGMELAEMLEITDKRSVNAFANFVKGADKIDSLRESITGVSGELEKMADEMSNNTAGSLKSLSSAWDEMMLTIYGSTGALKTFVDGVTLAVRDLTKLLKSEKEIAEETVNIAKGRNAGKEDYQRDIDAIERKKSAMIAAGEKETEAVKAATEEQQRIVREALDAEIKMRDEVAEKYQKALSILEDDNASRAVKKMAKKNLEKYTEEYSSLISSVNILEQRMGKMSRNLEKKASNGDKDKNLTDAQKKELEKLREEQLRIEQKYEEVRLEIMDDGLEKELGKMRLSYTQRIAEIKGNSRKENEIREMLAEEMQKAISEKEVSYYLNEEKKKTELSLASAKKNSEEERRLRIQLIDLEEEAEINAMKGRFENLEQVQAKYEQKRIEEEERYAGVRLKKIQEEAAAESIYRTAAYKESMQEVEIEREKGLISEEEYDRKRMELSVGYAKEQARESMNLIEEQMRIENLSEEQITDLKKKHAEAEIALAEAVRDAEIKAVKQAAEEQKRHIASLGNMIKQTMEFVNAFGELGGALYEARISKVEKAMEENEDKGEEEMERIEALEERGAISTEEAEARKRAAEEKTAKKNEELERKKAKLQEKQAKLNKAINVAGIISGTALAVINALQTKPFIPAGLAAAVVAGSMGAVQLATALATPIPKYAKGTDEHQGGLAIVGDGGVSETVITRKGVYITPDVPTLVDMPKGAQVIPYEVNLNRMKNNANDLNGLMAFRAENDLPPVSIVNDYSKLEKEIAILGKEQQKGFRELAKAIRDNRYRDFAEAV